MSTTPRLPLPLERLEAPRFLAPSRFDELLRCRLAVLGESVADVRLTAEPGALLGKLLHHVRGELMSGAWGNATTLEEALQGFMKASADRLDDFLKGGAWTSALAPLRETIGRLELNQREHRLRGWLAGARPCHPPRTPTPLPDPLQPHERTGPSSALLEPGEEVWVVSETLRLRGRVDRLERNDRDGFVVIDHKSGHVMDDSGTLVPRATLQVRLYALAIESEAGVPTSLFIAGEEMHPVEWTDECRVKIQAQLEGVLAELPAGATLKAHALASPGATCRTCLVRPVCERYLEEAPGLWNERQAASELPLDAWGEVVRRTESGLGVAVELREANGKTVMVHGLDADRHGASLTIGQRAYFFDLESSEGPWMPGRTRRPRNFHELPVDGGRRSRRARRLRVFLEG